MNNDKFLDILDRRLLAFELVDNLFYETEEGKELTLDHGLVVSKKIQQQIRDRIVKLQNRGGKK